MATINRILAQPKKLTWLVTLFLLTHTWQILTILLLVATITAARGADVLYNFNDFTDDPVTVKKVDVTPLWTPAASGGNIIVRNRKSYTNDLNGSLTITNMLAGTYRVEFYGSSFAITQFTNLIPNTNITINAANYLTGTIQAGGTVAWSASVSDARYIFRTNGTAVNLTGTTTNTINYAARFLGSLNYSNAPVNNYILRTDGNGNAVWTNFSSIPGGTANKFRFLRGDMIWSRVIDSLVYSNELGGLAVELIPEATIFKFRDANNIVNSVLQFQFGEHWLMQSSGGVPAALLPLGSTPQNIGASDDRIGILYANNIDSSGAIFLGSAAIEPDGGGGIYYSTGGTPRWQVNAAGHFRPFADNSYDVGTPSLRPRDIFVARSLQIPNGSAPTTDAFGEIAGDNDAWAASRGALQIYDGTANTYAVATLASDTPANGQVPVWNTGGTVTWESRATTLFIGTADTTVANTTTETTLIGTGIGSATLPANFLTAGKSINIKLRGNIRSAAGEGATLRLRLGGVSGTVLATSGIGIPDFPGGFNLDWTFTCRTTGASGTVVGNGEVKTHDGTVVPHFTIGNSGSVTIDTTASQVITPTIQWDAAAATTTVTNQQCIITAELP